MNVYVYMYDLFIVILISMDVFKLSFFCKIKCKIYDIIILYGYRYYISV